MLRTLILTMTLTIAGASVADTLLLDGLDMDAQTESSRPARGSSMASVESTFGSPAERQSAVGEPPITRWDYPGFSVYFEHEIVLHSVVRR